MLIRLFILVIVVDSVRHDSSQCARIDCSKNAACISCDFPDCQLGESVQINCTTVADCSSQHTIHTIARCRYCWQSDASEYDCAPRVNCSTTDVALITTTCEVHPNVICLGNRSFSKRTRCNWSSGISWLKTLIISLTLGGFGADRFYLGLWKSGIGKLFSFGGLGIWTIVDVVLIVTGYIRPADGSMYI